MVRALKSLLQSLRHRPALAAFLMLFVAFSAAWGVATWNAHQVRESALTERRRNDAVLCTFLNDTRTDVRGVVEDSRSNASLAPILAALPPDLAERLREPLSAAAQAQAERSRRSLERLANYDCDAFIRGGVPARPTSP